MANDDLLLIHGDEPFLIDRELRTWRDARTKAGCEVERFDAVSKLAPLKVSLLDVPMFAEARAIIVHNPTQLGGRARKGTDSADELAQLLLGRPAETAVCVVNHTPITAANPVLKAAKATGKIKEFRRIKGRDLRAWVEQEAKAQKVKLPAGGVDHVMTTSGGELGTIASELQKLADYSGGKPLSRDDLRALCSGEERVEIWSVMDRLMSDAPHRGVAALDALLDEGRAPQYVLITLASQIREILMARALLDEEHASVDLVARSLGLPPWRADRTCRHARRVNVRTATAWLRTLHRLDANGKRGEADDDEGLRIFIRRAATQLTA